MYTLLITFFLLAIVFSFLCSLWEAVLLSITLQQVPSAVLRRRVNRQDFLGKRLVFRVYSVTIPRSRLQACLVNRLKARWVRLATSTLLPTLALVSSVAAMCLVLCSVAIP